MFLAHGNLAVVLLALFVSLSLALQRVDDAVPKPREPGQQRSLIGSVRPLAGISRTGRFLLPADFAVKQKKYSIGTRGVGTFFRAWRNCIEEGKGLATIESAEEQAFLESMLQSISSKTRYWIGATNLGAVDNTTLTWITTDLPVQTAPDSIDLTADGCYTLSPSGYWKRHSCDGSEKAHPYLCEEYY
ncbi:protein A16-like [Anopheles marshallii]|uniref:protein A16-like n=1 Tax=Anopheles marshallii TaxID=1521116 RepID=UPI00237B3BF1|nr:protein A16-like [Anopheles marshallii]